MANKIASVDHRLCVACGCCAKHCPLGAVRIDGGRYAQIDPKLCVGCGRCARSCPADIITLVEREAAS